MKNNNNDVISFSDPLREVISDDDALDVVFELISKDPLYIETFVKYDKGEIKREELNEVIVRLALHYKKTL